MFNQKMTPTIRPKTGRYFFVSLPLINPKIEMIKESMPNINVATKVALKSATDRASNTVIGITSPLS